MGKEKKKSFSEMEEEMRREREKPFEKRKEEERENIKRYFVEQIQFARDIVKRAGEDPSERSDLVIAVFIKIIEGDFIGEFEKVFEMIEDNLDEIAGVISSR